MIIKLQYNDSITSLSNVEKLVAKGGAVVKVMLVFVEDEALECCRRVKSEIVDGVTSELETWMIGVVSFEGFRVNEGKITGKLYLL